MLKYLMSQYKVLIIYGGWGPEREVSIKSAQYVLEHIDNNKYTVHKLLLNTAQDLNKIIEINPDFVFIVLHGTHGEDGNIQAFLELLNLPYSSVGPLQSQICMDKFVFKQILKSFSIPTIPDIVLRHHRNTLEIWEGNPKHYELINKVDINTPINQISNIVDKTIGFPVFVKPHNIGSSVGINKVKRAEQLAHAIQEAKKYSNTIIIEQAIIGDELTVGFVGEHILPAVLIKPKKAEFFDYASKYEPNGADEICPAPIDEQTNQTLAKLTQRIKTALNLTTYSRVDFIREQATGKIYPLEVNTIPGMTQTSLLPQEARAYGWTDKELIDKIIEIGLENSQKS